MMVGQAGVNGGSNLPGAVYWPTTGLYTTFGGGGAVSSINMPQYNGWGGGASAIALGPPGLSLNGNTFWTNPWLKMLVVAGLLLLL